MHALNGLKYFSTIAAVVMKTLHFQISGMGWQIMAATTSGVATISNTYQDIVIDWGLLQKTSKNPWLRDKLLISNKFVYFAAIVSINVSVLKIQQVIFSIKVKILCGDEMHVNCIYFFN